MKKTLKTVLYICCGAILALFAVGGILTWNAAPSAVMPEGCTVELVTVEGHPTEVSWSPCDTAESYIVELFGDAAGEEPLFKCNTPYLTTHTDGVVHPALVRITPLTRWFAGVIPCWKKGTAFQSECVPSVAATEGLKWEADSKNNTVSAHWDCPDARFYLLTAVYGDGHSEEWELKEKSFTLTFDGDCPITCPLYGESCTLTVTPASRAGESITKGASSEAFTFISDDLYGTELTPKALDLGQNVYELSWNRTKGSGYEVFLECDGSNLLAAEIGAEDELSVTTPTLKPFKTYTLKITALGDMPKISAVYEFTTDADPMGCTVWPIQDLKLYALPDSTGESVGTVPQATALRVLKEEGDFFMVSTEAGQGYVQSAYCLINLPEYMGDLCLYNITNSYNSCYKIHTFGVAGVTGSVVAGYEDVLLEDGSFLVPLLYPSAQKLTQAAIAAEEQGYRIKIYDSYRPRTATVSLYNNTMALVENRLPYYNFYGETVPGLPEPVEEGYDYLRYYDLLNGNGFTLSSFLAPSGSYHNLGIAMDMTLVSLETGEELTMQTEMHDLSIYSAKWRNNENAKILESIMTAAGFDGISSEWWHYQDSASKNALKLNNWMNSGVKSCPPAA